jgi:hypothetical protein
VSDSTHDRFVVALGQPAGAPQAAVDAVQYHGLASLLRGVASSTKEISDASGVAFTEIEQGVQGLSDVVRIEVDGDRVIGVAGLTLTSTHHELRLPEVAMHTWCALDAVGIPAALELDAAIRTSCPHCHTPIDVVVEGGSASASTAVQLFLPTGPCENVRADFCATANLFCDTEHVSAWRASNPGSAGDVLDLAATAKLGRDMWGGYVHRK